jgi:hypothetical protein
MAVTQMVPVIRVEVLCSFYASDTWKVWRYWRGENGFAHPTTGKFFDKAHVLLDSCKQWSVDESVLAFRTLAYSVACSSAITNELAAFTCSARFL